MKKSFSIIICILISLMVLSCDLSIQFPSHVSSSILSFPSSPTNTYESIVKNEKGEITAIVKSASSTWLLAEENENRFTEIFLHTESNDSCLRTDYALYEIIEDGKILFKRTCFTSEKSIVDFALYDQDTGNLEVMTTNLPAGTIDLSWDPDYNQAIGYYNTFSNGTLFWLWEGGYGPLDLVIKDGNHSWNLKDDFPNFSGAKEGKTGNTGRADWSPNGDNIAFFASSDAIGITGVRRFEVKYKLYLMEVEDLKPYPVLDDIFSPYVIDWSPDSKYIAFIGKSGDRKQYGVWLFSVESGTVSLISEGEYRTVLWRDDGLSIVALRCEDVLECNQVEEFKLTN